MLLQMYGTKILAISNNPEKYLFNFSGLLLYDWEGSESYLLLFAHEMEVASEAFESGFVQFFLMVGVGDGNQGFGSVLHGFAV